MSESPLHSRRSRSRLGLGIALLLVGSFILASNLGFVIPRDLWWHWPWLLIALGLGQMLWPGNVRDRLGGGYWLLVIGGWGLVNKYELFGLDWGNSWPIFIIALGLRVVLGGIFNGASSASKEN